ncbi:MAG: exodeoxyribonuclease VII small subunit [Acidimicrobiia bacterium]|nr:exodeoxyribonuclease VII small subunit [Acidimicrobiia bacterium]
MADETRADDIRADEISYREAMAELEAILAAIEEEQVDVDELAAKVQRSAELIALCRARIEEASVAIEAIVDAMETGAGNG